MATRSTCLLHKGVIWVSRNVPSFITCTCTCVRPSFTWSIYYIPSPEETSISSRASSHLLDYIPVWTMQKADRIGRTKGGNCAFSNSLSPLPLSLPPPCFSLTHTHTGRCNENVAIEVTDHWSIHDTWGCVKPLCLKRHSKMSIEWYTYTLWNNIITRVYTYTTVLFMTKCSC